MEFLYHLIRDVSIGFVEGAGDLLSQSGLHFRVHCELVHRESRRRRGSLETSREEDGRLRHQIVPVKF